MEEWKDSAADDVRNVPAPAAEDTADMESAATDAETVVNEVEPSTEEIALAVSEETEGENNEEIDEQARKEELRRARWKEIKSNILFFGISFVVIYLIFYVFPPYLVSGTSMNKTLSDKAFGFGIRYCNLEKGDIIVFSNSKTNGDDYIKRVIACPGDTIEIINNNVYVNGKQLKEDYAYYDREILGGEYIINPDGEEIPKYHMKEITLGDDEYFVMGDNRNRSLDSRRIGVVHKKDVKCKMLFFIWGKH